MNPSDLPEHVSELRWLAYELGNEMKALERTAHPLAHQFLMHGLARRMAQVARSACSSLPEPVAPPVAGTPLLFGAPQSQRIRAILHAIGWHFYPRKQKSVPLVKPQHQGENRCCQQCGQPLCLRCQGCYNQDCHSQTVLYCLCGLLRPRADEEVRGDDPVSDPEREE